MPTNYQLFASQFFKNLLNGAILKIFMHYVIADNICGSDGVQSEEREMVDNTHIQDKSCS